MNRYLLSFFITIAIYAILFVGVFYASFSKHKITTHKTDNKISFQIMQRPKPKIPIAKKAIVKKVLKKKIHTKAKQKTNKIVKKQIMQNKEIFKIESQTKKTKTNERKTNEKQIQLLQKKFLRKIKQRININKYYPKVAKKRNIEGYVNISFTLLKNGNITHLKLTGSRKYFETSVENVLQESFPISTINSGFTFPLKVKLKTNFKLF